MAAPTSLCDSERRGAFSCTISESATHLPRPSQPTCRAPKARGAAPILLSAPKGRFNFSPGQRPGETPCKFHPALKGRSNPNRRGIGWCALSGLGFVLRCKPRAGHPIALARWGPRRCPGLKLGRAVGAPAPNGGYRIDTNSWLLPCRAAPSTAPRARKRGEKRAFAHPTGDSSRSKSALIQAVPEALIE